MKLNHLTEKNVIIHRMICEGYTRKQVAREFNLTTGRICEIFNRVERITNRENKFEYETQTAAARVAKYHQLS